MRVLSVNAEKRDDFIIAWVAIEDAIIDVLSNGTLILDFKKITEDDMSNVLMDAVRCDEDDALDLGIVLKDIDWLDDIVVSKLSLEIKRYTDRIEVKINRMISLSVGIKTDWEYTNYSEEKYKSAMTLDSCKSKIDKLLKYFPKETIVDIISVNPRIGVHHFKKFEDKPVVRKYKAKVSVSDKDRHITLKELGDLKDVRVDSQMSSEYLNSSYKNTPFQYYDYDHTSYLYLFFDNATIVVNYSGNSHSCLISPTSIIVDSLTSIGSEIVTMHNYDGVLNIYLKFNEYIKVKMKIQNFYGSDVKRIHVDRAETYNCTTPGIYIFEHPKED